MGVRFVYIALRPDLLPNDRDRAPYQETGEADWKPYWPDPEAVHPSLQHTVSAPGIRFASGELKFSHDLVTDIQAATKNREIVVIVVDPWSLYWDDRDPKAGYHAVLHKLDRTNDVHWCVVIPWNPEDPLLKEPEWRTAVEDATARAFPFRSGYLGYPKNTAYYRDHINSYEELKKEVVGALHTLKEGIKRTALITRRLPEGPSHDAISGSGPGS